MSTTFQCPIITENQWRLVHRIVAVNYSEATLCNAGISITPELQAAYAENRPSIRHEDYPIFTKI